ncbi:MAG TPA: chromate resistance protein ChrB domain-containing protein [Myxococcota bacterium]|nr:chromate resistance protein ChrB domain-containing protein [Myxococcota bacterium]
MGNDLPRWLLLIHQIPPAPAYLRVKVWRRLQRLGAVAIKNSVYVLPATDAALEDFQWTLREIVEGGGDASLCEARFVEGLSDAQVEALFRAARDADYAALGEEARAAERTIGRGPASAAEERRAEASLAVARLRRRLAEVVAIDFFEAPGRAAAETLLARLDDRVRDAGNPGGALAGAAGVGAGTAAMADLRGRTWVTRKGIHVDRIGSAWLVLRFIDPAARFKFVPAKGYRPQPGELRFDMFDAEFTHEGDQCTFEVLVARAGLGSDRALCALAEIIHDVDLKDGKFERDEAPGLDRLVAGIAMAHKDDEARLARGSAVFDDLYAYFERKQPSTEGRRR